MPAKGTRKRQPLERLIKTRLTSEQAVAFASRATACRMTQARYLRGLIAHDLSLEARPQAAARNVLSRDLLAHEVNQLGVQVRRLGVNINQLSKQANTAMVPLGRGEVIYMLNQLQLLTSAAKSALERVLA